MLTILANNMLSSDSKFCGSKEGRRLSELLWETLDQSRARPIKESAIPSDLMLVNRTIAFPVDLDNAITVMVEQTGLSRDALIKEALSELMAQQRR